MEQFLTGLMAKAPNPKTPWIKAKLSIKREELITSLQALSDEWVNLNVCEKKDGTKWYVVIDTWKPSVGKTSSQPIVEDDF